MASYAVTSRGRVRLVVVDALGREVACLVDDPREPGRYSAPVDAGGWARGFYFLRLESGGRAFVRRIIVE
jgi:hypothetical protein